MSKPNSGKAKQPLLPQNFKIEKNLLPPPPKGTGMTNVLRALEINDSVLFDVPRARVATAAIRVLGKGCYTTRAAEGGVRLWRTK